MGPLSLLYSSASSRNVLLILYTGTEKPKNKQTKNYESKKKQKNTWKLAEWALCSWYILSKITWLFVSLHWLFNTIPTTGFLEFSVEHIL